MVFRTATRRAAILHVRASAGKGVGQRSLYYFAFTVTQCVARVAERAGRGRRTRFAVVGTGDFFTLSGGVQRVTGGALNAFEIGRAHV